MAENKEIFIMLDSGHGGKDSGACKGSRHEADDVLKLVLAVGKKLTSDYSNVKVGYTRKTDIYEAPYKKAAEANEANADYFFSFHRNSAGATARGYETLVYSNTGIKKEVAAALNDAMKEIGFKNRGTKVRTDLTVLKKTNMPSWLLEVGFISNTADNKLFDKKFDDIVEKIVEVMADAFDLKKKVKTKKFATGSYNAYAVTTSNLNVRSGRGATHKKIGTLKKGTRIKVLYILKTATGSLWGSIPFDDGKDGVGYVCLDCMKPTV